MRKEIYSCDRCGKEVTELVSYQKSMFSMRITARIIKFDFDLCLDCNKKLRRWLKEKPSISTKRKEGGENAEK